jgi:putative salt-induced outer membrane protein YdiY
MKVITAKSLDPLHSPTLGAERTKSSIGTRSLTLVLAGLASAAQGLAAEPASSLPPVVVTNYVVVTNIIVVTNYVISTNVVLSTNAAPGVRDLAASRTNSALPDLSWVPPADRFDWIQLDTGEWLKGKIKAMQRRKLEFDSEKMDIVTFDWKDVRQVRSPRVIDVLFVDGKQVSGPVTISPKEVTVGGAEPLTVPRNELESLTPGGSHEGSYWSGKASVGLTLRAGNTESVDYTTQAQFQRRNPTTRFTLDYIGNFSSVNNQENANNHRVNTEFDLWLSRRAYLLLPFAEYYSDPFQNLASRATGGVGVGYDLVNQPKLEWSIATGPAYQYTWYDSSQPGEPTQQGTAALAFGTRFDWNITQHIEFILQYQGQYTGRQAGDTAHHTVGTLSIDLTKRLDLDVSIVWDRINNPKVGADGVQPKPDDFRLTVGLGLHL